MTLLTPLLTIETFRPEIFSLDIPFLNFTLEPRFYGLGYAIAVMIGYKIVFAEFARKKIQVNEDQTTNIIMIVFLGGMLGARAYEVFFEWSRYYAYQPWYEALAVWNGGLAIHGGILGGIVSGIFVARKYQIPFLKLADVGALCMSQGQAIGRWGNFFNGEAAGPVTDFWTGVVFPKGSVTYLYAKGEPVHPTMIYESLGNAVIFAILWKMRTYGFKHGMLLACYLILYTVWRMILTPLRMDNQFFTIGSFKIFASYATGGALILCSLFLIISYKLWETKNETI